MYCTSCCLVTALGNEHTQHKDASVLLKLAHGGTGVTAGGTVSGVSAGG